MKNMFKQGPQKKQPLTVIIRQKLALEVRIHYKNEFLFIFRLYMYFWKTYELFSKKVWKTTPDSHNTPKSTKVLSMQQLSKQMKLSQKGHVWIESFFV